MSATILGEQWGGSFTKSSAHSVLAKSCMLFLNLFNLEAISHTAPSRNDGQLSAKMRERLRASHASQSFLTYAACKWPYHFHEGHGMDGSKTLELISSICNTQSLSYLMWSTTHPEFKSIAESNTTDLIVASFFGFEALLKKLLEAAKDVESADTLHSSTALYWAVENGHVGPTKLLLEANSEANIVGTNHNGKTLLLIAVQARNKDIVKLLLENKAKVFSEGLLAIRLGYTEIVEIFLEQTADINALYSESQRALLSQAVIAGNKEIVQQVLAKKADTNVRGKDGRTPLYLAVLHGHIEIIHLLIDSGADIDTPETSSLGETPLIHAVRSDRLDIVELLLEKKADTQKTNNSGMTPLFIAASLNYVEIAQLLVKQDQKIDAFDQAEHQSPLSRAAQKGHLDIVRILLESNASTAFKNTKGQTPLALAAAAGRTTVVDVLLAKGAIVDAKSKSGSTALHEASLTGRLNVVTSLLEKEADPDCTNDCGQTPLFAAIENCHMNTSTLLLAGGANVNIYADMAFCPTPLLLAVCRGREDIVKLLLENGAERDPMDQSGQTPLSRAAEEGYESIVQLLIDNGANVNTKDNRRRSPLSWAAENGHDRVARLLLKGGAKLNPRGYDGYTPMGLARMNGHVEVERVLKEEIEACISGIGQAV